MNRPVAVALASLLALFGATAAIGDDYPRGGGGHGMYPGAMMHPGAMMGPGGMMAISPEELTDEQLDLIGAQMQRMHRQMERIAAASDPGERRTAVREHLAGMHEMIHEHARGAAGHRGDGRSAERLRRMEERMQHMEEMLRQRQ